jgi:hypothetical protein|tara:strand:- start:367 stop:480 length:114 start_codon:yes stop_codon:yes gene_type:complete
MLAGSLRQNNIATLERKWDLRSLGIFEEVTNQQAKQK